MTKPINHCWVSFSVRDAEMVGNLPGMIPSWEYKEFEAASREFGAIRYEDSHEVKYVRFMGI